MLPLRLGECNAHGQLGQVGQELVQRRIDEPNGDRQAVHRLEDADEVLALQWKKGVERRRPVRVVLGEDQALDVGLALTEEHVLGSQQADALGSHPARAGRVVWSVGVRAHPQAARGVCVRHDPIDRADQFRGGLIVLSLRERGVDTTLEVLDDRALDHRHLAGVDLARRTVDREHVAFLEHPTGVGGDDCGPWCRR